MHSTVAELNFERNKNVKALSYTTAVISLLFLVFVLLKWSLPITPPPSVDTGVEVNLGNTDQGLGNIQPQIPGEPAEEQQTNFNPPPSQQAQAETEPDVAENNEKDAPVIHTSSKHEKKKEVAVVKKKNKKIATKPISSPTPAPPKPKAV